MPHPIRGTMSSRSGSPGLKRGRPPRQPSEAERDGGESTGIPFSHLGVYEPVVTGS